MSLKPLLISLLLSAPLLAAPPASAPTPAEIQTLVAQLSSDQFQTRQSAENRLIALGTPAVPLLEPLLASASDDETRSRLQSILRAINKADLDHPTLLTLHMKNVLPKDAFAELARQADIEFTTGPNFGATLADLKNPVSLDADHQPFWNVTLDLCRQARLTPVEAPGIASRTITLKSGDEPKPLAPPLLTGPFHITPTTATSGGSVANRTILAFRMLVDPKLTVLRSTTFINTKEVSDSAGKSLLYKAPFSSDEFMSYYNFDWGIVSHILTPPDNDICNFKGTIRTQVLLKSTRLDIDKPLEAKNATRDLPFGTATLTDLSQKDMRNSRVLVLYPVLNVSASFTLAPGKEPLPGNTAFGGTLRLVDDVGRISSPVFLGTAPIANGKVSFSTTLNAQTPDGKTLGNPAHLLWDIPTSIQELTVPIEFKNIQMK